MSMLEEIQFRELEASDYDKGIYELLSSLTVTVKKEKDQFISDLEQIQKLGCIKTIVGEHNNKLICTVTLVTEPKLYRNGKSLLHIEDLIVDESYKNAKLGSKMIEFAKEHAAKSNCYKMVLCCSEQVKGFYLKQGFSEKDKNMVLYL